MAQVVYDEETRTVFIHEGTQGCAYPKNDVWEEGGSLWARSGDVTRQYPGASFPVPSAALEVAQEAFFEEVSAPVQSARVPDPDPVEEEALPAPAEIAPLPTPERRKGGRPKGSKNIKTMLGVRGRDRALATTGKAKGKV